MTHALISRWAQFAVVSVYLVSQLLIDSNVKHALHSYAHQLD